MCEFVCELLRMGSQEGLYEGADKGTLEVVTEEKHLLHPFLWEGNTRGCTIRQQISYLFHLLLSGPISQPEESSTQPYWWVRGHSS